MSRKIKIAFPDARFFGIVLSCLVVVAPAVGGEPQAYEVLASSPGSGEARLEVNQLHGIEISRASPQARRLVPSIDQGQLAEPESACGPTAILNWTLWYANNGLLGARPERDPRFQPEALYERIAAEIRAVRGEEAGAGRGPIQGTEMICVFDRVIDDLSEGTVRLSFEIHPAPMRIADLLRFTSGLRSAILITRVVEDPATGALGDYHAASAIAGDRAGYLMINNWGRKDYGRLVSRPDGQFFIPRDGSTGQLKIEALLCFIPFSPENPAEPVSVVGLVR